MDVIDGLSRFKTWLDTPNPPKPPKAPPVKRDYMAVPPFDIQEIPGAMRKEFLTNSAKLMERWFNGELNYGPTETDVQAEINQKGDPYPPSMYDMMTIKLEWVLKYRRAKEAYDYLINTGARSPRAYQALQRILRRYVGRVSVNTWTACGEKLPSLHRHFQFTFANVGSTFAQKIGELLIAAQNKNVPDDLVGVLGSFNIYAAIAYATFRRMDEVEISGIYVYIKDSYDFTDKAGEVSQYLGHWSKNGVVVVPYNGAAAALNNPALYIEYPVAVGNAQVAGNVYYPVQNKDFRQWALKHQRGGDFIVYSDYRFVPLNPPMTVYL
ncbi:DUF6402 family protein [Paraburkholderia sp. MMS20-SJTN17]|uniref:DUF6402 family protein n=2 Tax=Paraburkholderia translucens TaxID=2886945 RepID=A0ABS8KHA2_9BURK|nr:DUF6402 family protein [Paraburkholderia sp. MMS20-SJTN17]